MSHLLVVLSNALPGREGEFNEWYDAVHVHEMIDVLDGFESAQRFERVDLDGAPPSDYRYLAVYEVSDLEVARDQLKFQQEERLEAEAAGRKPLVAAPRAMSEDALVGFFATLGPRVTAGPAPSPDQR